MRNRSTETVTRKNFTGKVIPTLSLSLLTALAGLGVTQDASALPAEPSKTVVATKSPTASSKSGKTQKISKEDLEKLYNDYPNSLLGKVKSSKSKSVKASPVTQEASPQTEKEQVTEANSLEVPELAPAPVEEIPVVTEAPLEAPAYTAPEQTGTVAEQAWTAPAVPSYEAPAVNTAPAVVQGTPYTISTSTGTVTLGTYNVSGYLPVTFYRDNSSGAPNVPTYYSALCNGSSIASGTPGNMRAGTPITVNIPIQPGCKVIVSVKAPTGNYAGTFNSVTAVVGSPVGLSGSTPVTVKADWVSRPVLGRDSFTLAVPQGATGNLSVKMTTCTSQGGTSDATVTNGCGALVQKTHGTTGTISLMDSAGLITSTPYNVTANQHHTTVSLNLPRPATGPATIVVTRESGSAILVHAPGTQFVGSY